MKYELTEQSIQYVFGNKKYKNGQKTRNLKNVREGAKADDLQRLVKRSLACKMTHLMKHT